MAEKTSATNQKLLKQNFISQNAFDNSESSFDVSQGSVKSAEAQVQLAQNALRDAVADGAAAGVVAKRHVQPGEKVAFDSPLVTVVDLKDMELQAVVPAVDVPELAHRHGGRARDRRLRRAPFTGRIERINPATEPGTRAILVYVGIPNADGALRGGMFATGRIALAASAPVPTLPATAVRTEAGQTFVWTIEDGKLVKRSVVDRPPRRRRRPRRDQDRAAAGRAGAGRALRQPEGRRAGARQGAAPRRRRRRRRRRRPADAGRAADARDRGAPPCGSPASRSTTRSSPRW